MTDVKNVGFWNTSGPKRQISVGAGLVTGVGAALLGVTILPAALVAAGTTTVVWNGFKFFTKA